MWSQLIHPLTFVGFDALAFRAPPRSCIRVWKALGKPRHEDLQAFQVNPVYPPNKAGWEIHKLTSNKQEFSSTPCLIASNYKHIHFRKKGLYYLLFCGLRQPKIYVYILLHTIYRRDPKAISSSICRLGIERIESVSRELWAFRNGRIESKDWCSSHYDLIKSWSLGRQCWFKCG